MLINKLEICNFRGIKESQIVFPSDTRLVCLIGAGDSTKSTILNAIEWLFWPSWYLSPCDSDFFNCDTTTPIVLRGTFSEFHDSLLSEDRFGLYLRNPNAKLESDVNDEPTDGQPACLTIQLTIDATLEPKWEIVCNRKDPKQISCADRKMLAVGNVGENCAKDMVWGKYSVLQRYFDAKGVLHDAHTVALREVARNADLHVLDDIGDTLVSIGKQYGVAFDSQIKNRMLIQNGSFSSSVGVYDGDIPLNQRGTGSQRLLSMGLNIQATEGSALLLIDEIECGLEPYRLCNLVNELRATHVSAGQVIMTTHSPVAVSECTIEEILVVQSENGTTQAYRLSSDDKEANKTIQAQIRTNADAFLCRRLIVCEGKTEKGFVRSLDSYLARKYNYRMAYKGIGTANGEGSKIFKCTEVLRSCGYEVCLLMDSDLEEDEAQKVDLILEGISVFDWDKPNAIEEQIFFDIPTNVATEVVNIAVHEHGIDSIQNALADKKVPFEVIDDRIVLPSMAAEEQKKIGTIAKKKQWYKRIGLGEMVGDIVFKNWDMIDEDVKLKKLIDQLIRWILEDDRN